MHIYNHCLFPNPSIELLHIAEIAVIFSSSAIEEIVYSNTKTIDIKIDTIDRHTFLYNNSCYVIDKLPDENTFKNNVSNLEQHTHADLLQLINKYYPINSRPYSENIFNAINYIYKNRNKNRKIKKYIKLISKDIDDSYLISQIKKIDDVLFKQYNFVPINKLPVSNTQTTDDIERQTIINNILKQYTHIDESDMKINESNVNINESNVNIKYII